jgi:hypothetical protein
LTEPFGLPTLEVVMVTILSLWLAILLSAVVVWIASFIVWAVLPHHQSDYKGLPNEESVLQALTPLPPGQYNIPHLVSREELNQPEVVKKFEEGPTGFLTIAPRGVPSMGKGMALSFVYNLVISLFVAYVASRTLTADISSLGVFRVTGTVAWLAYGWAVIPDAVWFGKPWGAVGKHLGDALIYSLITAGIFGWLWPG